MSEIDPIHHPEDTLPDAQLLSVAGFRDKYGMTPQEAVGQAAAKYSALVQQGGTVDADDPRTTADYWEQRYQISDFGNRFDPV